MDFRSILTTAQAAGMAAGHAATPREMIVSNGTQQWHVADGLCGFAWVTIKPATHPFARWLKREGLASSAYGGGLVIWINEHNQSLERKTAHARAMAESLRAAFPDLRIYAESRID